MERTVGEYIQMCQWDRTRFFIFSNNVFDDLVYYSHLLPLVISLLFALFVFFKNPKLQSTRWLLVTTILLGIWLFFDLILWATEKPPLTMFFWSIVNMVEPMIYAGVLFFMYSFINGRSIPFKKKFIALMLLLPTVILASTNLNLSLYDLSNCWREALEGPLPYYSYAVEAVFILWILTFGFKKFFQFKEKREKIKVALTTFGAIFFLLAFAMGNIVGSLLVNWEIGQYGLFGIPIFIALLSYLVVRYSVFNIKLIGAQVLVFALGLLVLGMLFVRSIESVRMIAVVTLVLITFLGYLLIRGVKKEVAQREELEKLNKDLKDLIQQRESLVHLITHKVKGSFTRTKYIFAEMLNDSFGVLTPEMKKMAQTGLESDDAGIKTIDMVLNASNLESGIVQYDMKKVDFKDTLLQAITEKKISAEAKGLKIETDIGDVAYPILGDAFWLKEVANNLIDNSIKYTTTGTITVGLSIQNGKVLFTVKDTGVGITPEDMAHLFTEGGRGKESVKMNVDSTGYGLFSVKLIIDAHGGRVWAESLGKGKGSTFFVELGAV